MFGPSSSTENIFNLTRRFMQKEIYFSSREDEAEDEVVDEVEGRDEDERQDEDQRPKTWMKDKTKDTGDGEEDENF